ALARDARGHDHVEGGDAVRGHHQQVIAEAISVPYLATRIKLQGQVCPQNHALRVVCGLMHCTTGQEEGLLVDNLRLRSHGKQRRLRSGGPLTPWLAPQRPSFALPASGGPAPSQDGSGRRTTPIITIEVCHARQLSKRCRGNPASWP